MKKPLMICMIAAALLSGTAAAGTVRLRHTASLYVDERGGGLLRPEGAACNDHNTVVVADTGNGQLLRYSYQQGMFTFEAEVKIPELTNPAKVQLSSKGEIFAFDEKQVRIIRVGADGSFKGRVQPANLPAPGTWTPRSFALDGKDNIYILDIASGRVLVLDPAGTYWREIRYPREYGYFADMAVTAEGTVYALDTVQKRVYAAPPTAQALTPLSEPLKEHLRFPTALAVDSSGSIFVVDRNGGAIVVLNPGGNVLGRELGAGWKEGLLRYPAQVCVTGQGTLFVADRENNRIQVYTVIR